MKQQLKDLLGSSDGNLYFLLFSTITPLLFADLIEAWYISKSKYKYLLIYLGHMCELYAIGSSSSQNVSEGNGKPGRQIPNRRTLGNEKGLTENTGGRECTLVNMMPDFAYLG